VPQVPATAERRTTALQLAGPRTSLMFGDVKEVDASRVSGQWRQTINAIVDAVGKWPELGSGQWSFDTVDFGLTLSAEGQLLFIAKAGASASVTARLTRASRCARARS
jgi:hypothetical protein